MAALFNDLRRRAKTYSSAYSILTGTVTGFVGAETQALATVSTLSSTTQASGAKIGSYAITCKGKRTRQQHVFTRPAGIARTSNVLHDLLKADGPR